MLELTAIGCCNAKYFLKRITGHHGENASKYETHSAEEYI